MKLTFLFYCLSCSFLIAQTFPTRPQPLVYVNDYAHFLTTTEQQQLNAKLQQYSDSTSTQLVVVTVENMGGLDEKTYALQLATTWKIGQKDINNGLLLLVAKQEHKLRIELGIGMEKYLPEAYCKRIIDELLTPNFKQQHYYQALHQATDAIIQRLADEHADFAPDDGTVYVTRDEEGQVSLIVLTHWGWWRTVACMFILLSLGMAWMLMYHQSSYKQTFEYAREMLLYAIVISFFLPMTISLLSDVVALILFAISFPFVHLKIAKEYAPIKKSETQPVDTPPQSTNYSNYTSSTNYYNNDTSSDYTSDTNTNSSSDSSSDSGGSFGGSGASGDW